MKKDMAKPTEKLPRPSPGTSFPNKGQDLQVNLFGASEIHRDTLCVQPPSPIVCFFPFLREHPLKGKPFRGKKNGKQTNKLKITNDSRAQQLLLNQR